MHPPRLPPPPRSSIDPHVKQVLRKLSHRQGRVACPLLGDGVERLRGKAWAAVVRGEGLGLPWLLMGTCWLLQLRELPDGCAWLLLRSEGHDVGGQRVDLGFQGL